MCGSSQGPTIINANILQQTVLYNTEISVALTHLHQDRCPFPHHIWYNRRLGCSWRSRPVCGWAFAAVGSGSASGNRKRACVVYIYAVRTEGTAQFWIPSDILGGGSNKRKWINVTFLDSDIVLYSFSHRRECIHMYLQYIPYTCYSSTQLNKLSRDPLFVLLHLVLCCCDKSYNSLYIM